MEPRFQLGLQCSNLYFQYWFTVTLHMSGGINHISMDMFYHDSKKKKKKQLDDIWNYFGMENPLFEILKKYFDVKMTPINDDKQGKWGERQGYCQH